MHASIDTGKSNVACVEWTSLPSPEGPTNVLVVCFRHSAATHVYATSPPCPLLKVLSPKQTNAEGNTCSVCTPEGVLIVGSSLGNLRAFALGPTGGCLPQWTQAVDFKSSRQDALAVQHLALLDSHTLLSVCRSGLCSVWDFAPPSLTCKAFSQAPSPALLHSYRIALPPGVLVAGVAPVAHDEDLLLVTASNQELIVCCKLSGTQPNSIVI